MICNSAHAVNPLSGSWEFKRLHKRRFCVSAHKFAPRHNDRRNVFNTLFRFAVQLFMCSLHLRVIDHVTSNRRSIERHPKSTKNICWFSIPTFNLLYGVDSPALNALHESFCKPVDQISFDIPLRRSNPAASIVLQLQLAVPAKGSMISWNASGCLRCLGTRCACQ